MKIIFAKHLLYYETGHLGEVLEEMQIQGSPTLRAVEYKNQLYLTEGSHRIASAFCLEIIPKIVIEEIAEDLTTDEFWDKVIERLPKYEFEHVLVLDLRKFKQEMDDEQARTS